MGRPVRLGCPADKQSNGMGLCYDRCEEGWEWDLAQRCKRACPSNWLGTKSLDHCQKKTHYSKGVVQEYL